MRILFGLFLSFMVFGVLPVSAQTKKSDSVVDEFNRFGNELARQNTSYDLRPIYNELADFLYKKMKERDLALVVVRTYGDSNTNDYVTYHVIDSLDEREPRVSSRLQIYFTSDLNPITTMYYVSGAFFTRHKTSIREVDFARDRTGRYIGINKELKRLMQLSNDVRVYTVR